MGAGIAAVVSLHNEVVLIDVSAEQLQKAIANIEKTLAKWLEKGIITTEASTAARSRLNASTAWETLANVDMVIEAVPELWTSKSPYSPSSLHLCAKIPSLPPIPRG